MKLSFKVGLTPDDLYRLTWADFFAAVDAYKDTKTESLHMFRTLIAEMYNSQPNWGSQPKKRIKPSDIIQLDTDEINPIQKMTGRERLERFKKNYEQITGISWNKRGNA